MAAIAQQEISFKELIDLGAQDTLFFGRHWFPKALRQRSPLFHEDIIQKLENPLARYVALSVHRDGAKTTLLRVFTAKRIAYGVSHTIIFVSKTQDHAIKSIEWIKRQITHNKAFSTAFDLRKGDKWTSEEIEIFHGVDEYPIRIIAYGITGQIRGVNIDDYRPDLIVVDDPCDEQNANTKEQREKIKDLFFGTIYNTLAPASDDPTAKLVMLQTPLDKADLLADLMKDPMWVTAKYSCFDENGESRWPDRFPTDVLRKEKAGFIARNKLSLWMREKECELMAPELALFDAGWLRDYDILPDPNELLYGLGIDPAPPKSDALIAKGETDFDKDFMAFAVWAFHTRSPNRWLVEYSIEKDPLVEWQNAEFFRLISKYPVVEVGVETTAFQQNLVSQFRTAMRARRRFVTLREFDDKKRSKYNRIDQVISPLAANGYLHCMRTLHTDFVDEFERYPRVEHDHLLDATAVIFSIMENRLISVTDETDDYLLLQEDRETPELGDWRSCP